VVCGWAIWYKRLEAGTFQFPFAETGRKEIAAWELGLLLEGIDLSKGRRRKRYSLPATVVPGENQPADKTQERS
jgi:transposase